MNYLAHFVLAERDHGCTTTAACSLLPDLLGYAGATQRTHRVPPPGTEAPNWQAVRDGMAHHIAVDRVFHAHEWFDTTMAETGAWLREQDSPLREHWSLWVLRHVTIELVIDHHLLGDDADLPARVYAGLETLATDTAAVDALEEQFTPAGALHRYLAAFLERRWLHHYGEPASIAHVLDRIFTRLLERKPRIREIYGVEATFTDDERDALTPFIDEVVATVARHGQPPMPRLAGAES